MRTQLRTLQRARTIRALIIFLLVSLFLYILVICNKIPHIQKEIERSENQLENANLEFKDPYLKINFFDLHDLSKTEYTLSYSYSKDSMQLLLLDADYGRNALSSNFSGIDGGEEISFGDMSLLGVESGKLHFYTKNIVADNTQMIRNFFLTEFILFLLALFGKEVYKLLGNIHSSKVYSHQRIFCVKTAKKHFVLNVVLSLITMTLLYIINIVPNISVTSNNHTQKKPNLFALHDISCSNYHLQFTVSSDADKYVSWQSEEIVEVIPETFEPLSCKIGSNSLTFSNVPIGQDLDVRFFTRNLQSSNYQEIRLFILTTLLLFFLERSFFYFRKWMCLHFKKKKEYKEG